MKRAPSGQRAAVLAVLLAACASPPPASERADDSIVLTKYAPGVDFSAFKTYYLRPQIRTVDDDGELAPVDDDTAEPLLAATEQNLTSRGFVAAAKDEADVGLELLYVDHVTTTYWCYSWYDPYYWGYPAWGYYPYYGGCDATVWKSGMLSTLMVDLTDARENPDGGEGGAGGAGPATNLPGIWFSGVYAVSLSSQDARAGINQAFTQSPYIAAGK